MGGGRVWSAICGSSHMAALQVERACHLDGQLVCFKAPLRRPRLDDFDHSVQRGPRGGVATHLHVTGCAGTLEAGGGRRGPGLGKMWRRVGAGAPCARGAS
eukprot:scaffold29372_cov25-Tisochrysis_lutea.AAC.3